MRFFISLLFYLLVMPHCLAMSNMASTDQKDIQDLEKTAEWVFKMGYPLYEPYKNVEQNSEKDWEYIFKIINKYDVRSKSIMPISKYPNASLQAMFSIRKGHLGLTLNCYHRKISGSGKVYEYWHKKTYCSEKKCADRTGIVFIFTEADSLFTERKIIHQTDKFIPIYQYGDGVKIEFPITPKMTAAFAPDMDSHPAAFKDSPFDSLRVKLDRKVGWVWDE